MSLCRLTAIYNALPQADRDRLVGFGEAMIKARQGKRQQRRMRLAARTNTDAEIQAIYRPNFLQDNAF